MTARVALVVAVALLLVAPGIGHADARVISLRNAHTGERVHIRPFTVLGRLSRRAEARLTGLLRGRDRAARIRLYPRTIRLLAHLQRHFGGRELEVYSAFRGDGDPAGGEGYHTLGRAVDFRIGGVSPRDIFDRCLRLHHAGCGLYPNRAFVHVDARPYQAVWVDLTEGRGSRYVTDVFAWLAAHPEAGR